MLIWLPTEPVLMRAKLLLPVLVVVRSSRRASRMPLNVEWYMVLLPRVVLLRVVTIALKLDHSCQWVIFRLLAIEIVW